MKLLRMLMAIGPRVSSLCSAGITSKVAFFVCLTPSHSPCMVTVTFLPTMASEGTTVTSATWLEVIV